MENRSHLGSVFRFDGVGIVPEIEAIDAFIVEPETGMMGVIDAFAGALLEREAASDGGAFSRAERIEDGFFQRGGPNVGGERLAVDRNVDAASLLVDSNGDAVRRIRAGGHARREKHGYGDEDERCTDKEDSHG